jgi:hypothetical protein
MHSEIALENYVVCNRHVWKMDIKTDTGRVKTDTSYKRQETTIKAETSALYCNTSKNP